MPLIGPPDSTHSGEWRGLPERGRKPLAPFAPFVASAAEDEAPSGEALPAPLTALPSLLERGDLYADPWAEAHVRIAFYRENELRVEPETPPGTCWDARA